jgi:Fur family transcriptional regulator, stress-responsive regulator
VDCAVGTTPCLEPSDDHGFTIDEAEVIYWATCPRCAGATAEPPRPPSAMSTPTTQSRAPQGKD